MVLLLLESSVAQVSNQLTRVFWTAMCAGLAKREMPWMAWVDIYESYLLTLIGRLTAACWMNIRVSVRSDSHQTYAMRPDIN